MFEAQEVLIAKLVGCLDFFNDHDILDADAKGVILVVAWFIRQHVAGCERHFGKLNACADADGAFVDVKEGADSVACAVAVR